MNAEQDSAGRSNAEAASKQISSAQSTQDSSAPRGSSPASEHKPALSQLLEDLSAERDRTLAALKSRDLEILKLRRVVAQNSAREQFLTAQVATTSRNYEKAIAESSAMSAFLEKEPNTATRDVVLKALGNQAASHRVHARQIQGRLEQTLKDNIAKLDALLADVHIRHDVAFQREIELRYQERSKFLEHLEKMAQRHEQEVQKASSIEHLIQRTASTEASNKVSELLQKLDQQQQSHEGETSSLKSEVSELKRDLQVQLERNRSLEQRCSHLEERVIEADCASSNSKSELQRLQRSHDEKIERSKAIISRLRGDIEELKDFKRKGIESSKQQLKNASTDHEKHIGVLQASHGREIADLIETHQRQIDELGELSKNKIEQFTAQSNEILRARTKQLSDQLSRATERIKFLESNDKRAELAALQARHAALAQNQKLKDEQVAKLEKRLSTLEKLRDRRLLILRELRDQLQQVRRDADARISEQQRLLDSVDERERQTAEASAKRVSVLLDELSSLTYKLDAQKAARNLLSTRLKENADDYDISIASLNSQVDELRLALDQETKTGRSQIDELKKLHKEQRDTAAAKIESHFQKQIDALSEEHNHELMRLIDRAARAETKTSQIRGQLKELSARIEVFGAREIELKQEVVAVMAHLQKVQHSAAQRESALEAQVFELQNRLKSTENGQI